MKRFLLFSVIAFLATSFAFAQKILQANEVPSELGAAYMNKPGEFRARVDVKCINDIPLEFETQCDKDEDMRLVKESDGVETTYSLYFDADPSVKEYTTRLLTISSPGYDDIYYSLANLLSGQWITINVTDPNITVNTGCYNEHRNKGVLEIKNMNYSEAKREFLVASQCAEANQTENDANIALADSLTLYRAQAENALKLLDYRMASSYFEKIISLNPYDSYAMEQNARCITTFRNDCDVIYNQAEFYYNEHEYAKAQDLYQQLLDRGCNYELQANTRLQNISKNARSRKDHAHVITYEWMKDCPIGLHTGTYNMHKAGGWFYINLNPKIFDAIRNECEYQNPAVEENIKYPEANIAFGWTIKIKNPVWIHFGPGFTGKFYYGKYKKDHYPYNKKNEDKEDPLETHEDLKHFNIAPAISPMVGITVKYSYFAARVSYQYRFTLKKGLQDFMEPHRISVGIGVAF